MVFGRVAQERWQLNIDTLWSGAPYAPENPRARAAIPRVRALLAEGRYADAAALASADVMANPLQQMAYGSAGDLFLQFEEALVPRQYVRELDLESAMARTAFRDARGSHTRSVYVSGPQQVLVSQLRAPRGTLNFALAYRGPRRVKYISPDFAGLATAPPAGAPDWLGIEALREDPGLVDVQSDGADGLVITGHNEKGPGVPAALSFALRLRVITDGEVTSANGRLAVRGASRAMLQLAAATSFVRYDDVSGDPLARTRSILDEAARHSPGELERAHLRDYRKLYSAVSLELPAKKPADEPTDVRVAAAETADDPSLAALYFQYARYLLISSSRPGTEPANLQGIWNEGVNPPWGSKFTININTEMNYWPADPAGLGACVEPLFRMVEELAVTGARAAREMYGARGWVAHHNTDLWRAAAPIDGPFWGLWPCGGAWLCNSLWDHYDYGRDPATLRRLYPLMRDASLFFLDTLVDDASGRGLVTSPSLSPENAHPFGSSLCVGPAMDRQILRDLFAHTVTAGRELELDASLLPEIERAAQRLAPDRIGRGGQLQEWLEDWDLEAPEPHHRHVSHLYAVYPSGQINTRDTPALADAAKVSLDLRGDFATGWGTAWRLCLWARLGDGERAHRILQSLMGPRRTYPNLFDAHPPFQIDGNFGGAAGILEMLLQSWGGEIHLLPALPRAWPEGEVRGVRARGGLVVDLAWRDGELRRLELTGAPSRPVRLRYRQRAMTVQLDSRGRYRSSSPLHGLSDGVDNNPG
jgi:alpha-L-fucosidase 2